MLVPEFLSPVYCFLKSIVVFPIVFEVVFGLYGLFLVLPPIVAKDLKRAIRQRAMGPRLNTHILIIREFTFPLTQDICYTWFSGRNSLCNSDAFTRYFLRTRQLHTLIVWELIFQLHPHLLGIVSNYFRERGNRALVIVL